MCSESVFIIVRSIKLAGMASIGVTGQDVSDGTGQGVSVGTDHFGTTTWGCKSWCAPVEVYCLNYDGCKLCGYCSPCAPRVQVPIHNWGRYEHWRRMARRACGVTSGRASCHKSWSDRFGRVACPVPCTLLCVEEGGVEMLQRTASLAIKLH